VSSDDATSPVEAVSELLKCFSGATGGSLITEIMAQMIHETPRL